MGFDREKFTEYIRDEFSYDGASQRIISNLIEYGQKHLDFKEGQLVNFIQEVLDDMELEEIQTFEIKEDKYMEYKDIRENIETMANDNLKDFVKAVISFEKGIEDEQALDTIYDEYMENESMGLLNDEFDYLIDELMEQGKIKENKNELEARDDLVNIVGNVVGEVETIERENADGIKFEVSNFSIVSKDDGGNKVYTNLSAYGDKSKDVENLQSGDFVKIFGQIRISIDNNGKEHTNVRVLKTNLLKAREQNKTQNKGKKSILGQIKDLQKEEKSKPKIKDGHHKGTER